MRVGAVICLERVAVAKGRKMFNFQILMAFGVYHHLLTSYCRCSQYISAAVGVYHHRMASGRDSCCFRWVALFHETERNRTKPDETERNPTKPSDYYRQMCYKNVSNSNISEGPSANALSALQHHLSGTLSLSLFKTGTRSRYSNLDLKHICSPPSLLLN